MEKILKRIKQISRHKNKGDFGFTLVEMIVSIGIFTVVMVLAVSSFLNVNSILRKTETFREINDNFAFVFEAMTREIRTGYNYDDLGSTGDQFKFKSAQGVNVTYRLQGDTLQRKSGAGGFIDFTPEGIIVDKMEFILIGKSASDHIRPRVIVVMGGHTAGNAKIQTRFDLQTTISQRKPSDG